jgi:hypothetical protein
MGEVLCFDGRIIMEMQRNRKHCHQTDADDDKCFGGGGALKQMQLQKVPQDLP